MDEITGIPKGPAGEPMGEAVSRVDQLIAEGRVTRRERLIREQAGQVAE